MSKSALKPISVILTRSILLQGKFVAAGTVINVNDNMFDYLHNSNAAKEYFEPEVKEEVKQPEQKQETKPKAKR